MDVGWVTENEKKIGRILQKKEYLINSDVRKSLVIAEIQ